jgi:mRNA interferase YafQ
VYEFDYTARFIRDVKKLKRKHYDMSKLDAVLDVLQCYDTHTLSTRYRDHRLQGQLSSYRELHIEGDWLLVYRIDGKRLVLTLARTGVTTKHCPRRRVLGNGSGCGWWHRIAVLRPTPCYAALPSELAVRDMVMMRASQRRFKPWNRLSIQLSSWLSNHLSNQRSLGAKATSL